MRVPDGRGAALYAARIRGQAGAERGSLEGARRQHAYQLDDALGGHRSGGTPPGPPAAPAAAATTSVGPAAAAAAPRAPTAPPAVATCAPAHAALRRAGTASVQPPAAAVAELGELGQWLFTMRRPGWAAPAAAEIKLGSKCSWLGLGIVVCPYPYPYPYPDPHPYPYP